MVVLSKSEARERFAQRLNEILNETEGAPSLRGRPAWVGREFKVSGEMARKWLTGEAMPNQARLTGIAIRLKVNPAWLRDGIGDKYVNLDALFTELETVWRSITNITVKGEIIAFARFKLGGSATTSTSPKTGRPRNSRNRTY